MAVERLRHVFFQFLPHTIYELARHFLVSKKHRLRTSGHTPNTKPHCKRVANEEQLRVSPSAMAAPGGVAWYRRKRSLAALKDAMRGTALLPYTLPLFEDPSMDLYEASIAVAQRNFAFMTTAISTEVPCSRARARARGDGGVLIVCVDRGVGGFEGACTRVRMGARRIKFVQALLSSLPRGPKRTRRETPLTDLDLLGLDGAERPLDEIKFEEYFGVTRWTAEALTEAFVDCGLPLKNGLVVAPSGHVRTPLQATLVLLARLHLPGDWGTVEDVFRDERTGCGRAGTLARARMT